MGIGANRPMDATKFSDCGKSLLSWEGEDTAACPSSRIGVSIKQDGAYTSLVQGWEHGRCSTVYPFSTVSPSPVTLITLPFHFLVFGFGSLSH